MKHGRDDSRKSVDDIHIGDSKKCKIYDDGHIGEHKDVPTFETDVTYNPKASFSNNHFISTCKLASGKVIPVYIKMLSPISGYTVFAGIIREMSDIGEDDADEPMIVD